MRHLKERLPYLASLKTVDEPLISCNVSTMAGFLAL